VAKTLKYRVISVLKNTVVKKGIQITFATLQRVIIEKDPSGNVQTDFY